MTVSATATAADTGCMMHRLAAVNSGCLALFVAVRIAVAAAVGAAIGATAVVAPGGTLVG
jgi:hypothetical protein